MKNSAKTNYSSVKGYFRFILVTIVLGIILTFILAILIIRSNNENNAVILKKEAANINKTITEAFDYSNKINSYIGKQIAENGAKDLNFILKIFRQSEKIQNKNAQLLSWSVFDWVDPNNFQLVNSRIGVRKNPPDMSDRKFADRSPQNPWTLQVSPPVFGNPSELWVIPAGTGVTDENGKYLGAVVIGFSVEELENMVEQRLNDPISFIVFDEEMNVIIKSQDNEFEGDKNFYKEKFNFSSLEKNKDFLPNEINLDNIKYSFYHKFDKYPYIVLVGFNKAVIKKDFNNSILPIIIGFGLITFLFLMILYIFKTRILVLMIREKKLINQDLSKTKLIRAASHDLKNYIFGICGLAKLILQDKQPEETKLSEDLKIVQEISSQSEELMGFVEDLLDTNQNNEGEFILGNLQICDIAVLAKRMVILNKNFAIENHIKLEAVNLSENKKLNIKCDVRRIKQILNNLISNSIKYSPPETTVVVETSFVKESDEVCILVSDNGIGMNQEEIDLALSGGGEKIDKSVLNKAIDSHGIGMPIIKKLVDLHKGRLDIESKKGVGTKIKIYFKASKSAKEESEKDIKLNQENLTNFFKDKSVLLAEDDPVGNKIRVLTS